jgi:hypothetical protein
VSLRKFVASYLVCFSEESVTGESIMTWCGKVRLGLALIAALFGVAGSPTATAQAKKPNIVFILTDNLGYGELGVYGGGILRGAPTPRIDKLASEGTRLLNFNVEAQCTPSRSALMTGRFSIRSGTYEVPIGGAPDGLTLWEITIAQRSEERRVGKEC